jgi:arylsulfatase A-like enzyme
MRKDAINVYGRLSSTPNLDSLAKEGVLYNNCITPAPWTFPAHVSFLTGMYASEHGLHETYEIKGRELWYRKDDNSPETIVDFLRKRGYSAIGISANPWLHAGTIFTRNFNFFSTDSRENRLSSEEKEAIDRASKYGKTPSEIAIHLVTRGRIGELVKLYSTYRRIQRRSKQSNYPLVKGGDKIARFMEEGTFEEPFFLFVNFMEMHDPYTSYELSMSRNASGQPGLSMADLLGLVKISPEAMQEIRTQYYKEASYVDSFFGEMLTQLKKKNLYDNTLIIATSDHGQALKEHDYFGHSIFLYDEIVEIPLIVKYPENEKKKIPAANEGYQSLVHIPKMIRALVENDYNKDYLTERVAFSESFGIPHQSIRKVSEDLRKRFDIPRKAVYKGGYKLTVNWANGDFESLTLKGKTLEIADNRSICEDLKNEFSILDSSAREPTLQPSAMSPEEELEVTEKLRDLGYV